MQKYPICTHAEGRTLLERVYYGVDVSYCYVDVDVVHVDVCVEDGDEDDGPGHFWIQGVLMLMF